MLASYHGQQLGSTYLSDPVLSALHMQTLILPRAFRDLKNVTIFQENNCKIFLLWNFWAQPWRFLAFVFDFYLSLQQLPPGYLRWLTLETKLTFFLFVHPPCSRLCRFQLWLSTSFFGDSLPFPLNQSSAKPCSFHTQIAPLPSKFHYVYLSLLYFSYCTISTSPFKINFTCLHDIMIVCWFTWQKRWEGSILKSIMWSPGVRKLSVWVEICLPQKQCWNPNPQDLGEWLYL